MMADANYYDPANHEVASEIVIKEIFRLNIRQANRSASWPKQADLMDFLWLIRFNGADQRRPPCEKNHAEVLACNSLDLIARLGANETVAQGHDRAGRQLCADRPDRRRQTGLFDEVREFAGPAATAAG
jgi:hypothetical protein